MRGSEHSLLIPYICICSPPDFYLFSGSLLYENPYGIYIVFLRVINTIFYFPNVCFAIACLRFAIHYQPNSHTFKVLRRRDGIMR